jgi:hypothetical protein
MAKKDSDQTISPVTHKVIEIPVSPPSRRAVRYRCARIMNGNDEVEDGLKESIESQFYGDMGWKNFMVQWDIDKEDASLVVNLRED